MKISGKIQKIVKHRLFEPVLLFCLFYLPGFLQQWQFTDFSIMNSINYQLVYSASVLPQILLTLYLMKCSPVNSEMLAEGRSWRGFYGFKRFTVRSLLGIAVLLVVIWMYVFFISILSAGTESAGSEESARWIISSKPALVLFIFTSQFTGWSEELFFRGFLLRRAITQNSSPLLVVMAVSVIFGALHIYQGLGGFFVTAGIGFILAMYYLRTGDLTATAITHGLYNLTVLAMSFANG
jgi:membrane protease YdiL (CAAX protease family)